MGPTQNKTTNSYIYIGIAAGIVLIVGIPGLVKVYRVRKEAALKRETRLVKFQKNPLVIRSIDLNEEFICTTCSKKVTLENLATSHSQCATCALEDDN